MAIIEKVTLVDDYSAKAKKIEASTSAMASAMDSIRGNASKMGSALKSAFSRSYKVDIKDTGSKYLESRVEGLKKSLDGLNKPYEVTITAKESRFDKVKANLSSIKNTAKSIKKPLDSAFTSAKKFKMDVSSFRAAQREARQIGREISAFTGKRHKVHIDMENPIKSAFKGGFDKMFGGLKSGFSKVGGFFSKLNPFKGFGGGSADPGGGGGSPNIMKSIIGGNLITGAITKGIGAVTSLAGSTVGAGMSRLENIQSAKARLRGQTNADGSRKFDDAAIKNISKSAMDAVSGTAYGFGDAMSVASSAIAAGVKQDNLQGYLTDISNIAAATGSDYGDIGAIMNKIQTTGKLQGDELMQLSDRGLPMLDKIAEMKGVDSATAREMISKGQISAQDAFEAASIAAGNSAAEMANTWEGAKMNFGSALSKLGAGLLGGSDGEEGGIFGAMTPALLKVNEVLNGLIPTFQKVGDSVSTFVTGGFKKAQEGFVKIKDKLDEAFTPIKDKLSTAFDTLKEAFAPVKEAFASLFDDGIGDGFSLLGTAIDIVAGAFGVLADIIVALNPVWEALSSFITGVVLPAFESVSSFVVDTVVPAFSNIADMVGGWVTEAFQLVGDAVNIAKAAFDAVKGAVDSAVAAIKNIPAAVGNLASSAWNGIKESASSLLGRFTGKNATGTDYFSGGLTQINEQGQEMMKLPMGTKIYPAGATRRALEKEARATRPVTSNQDTSNSIVINVNGANMTNKDVGRVISDELRRLGVVV